MGKNENDPRRAAVDVKAALDRDEDAPGPTTLSTGVRATLVPVALALLQETRSFIKYPPPPTYVNPKNDREEPNYLDPAWREQCDLVDNQRQQAVLDTVVLMGVQLDDPVPPPAEWLWKLERLVKLGHLDLSPYDMEDPLDLEFVYKRYVAVSGRDITRVARLSGMTDMEVDRAAAGFRGDEGDEADIGGEAI